MNLVSDEQKHDEEMDIDYRATVWEHHGHALEVNQDEYGFHARLDGDYHTAEANMTAAELLDYVHDALGDDCELLP